MGDSNTNSQINKLYKTNNIKNMLHDFMADNDITQHNFENTRHVKHQNSSCIDHIYSNVPNKIIKVKTHKNNFSDHSIITVLYTSKEQFYTPKLIKTRNFRNLN